MHNPARLRLVVGTVVAALLSSAGTINAVAEQPWADSAFAAADADAGAWLPVGSADAAEAVASMVAQAATMPNEAGQWLLPPGTVVDGVEWDGNVAQISLTVPADLGDWYLSPLDQEAVARFLASPFADDASFGGTRILVRVGPEQPYDSLEQFLVPRATPAPPPDLGPTEVPQPFAHPRPEGTPAIMGPTAQAARQPVGALSGVVVFASAGHGWTAGDSAWYLQRPVLLGMAEDYGNIDQLNYFVNYAYNAGATVVPFRPVGWQPLEIVLDNDDVGVTYTGTWSDGSSSKYYENGVVTSGIAYKWISADTTETHTARYTPTITVSDFYPVFCFTIAGSNRTLQTYRVSHSGGVSEITIDHRNVGNGWIWLGDYHLVAGGDNYVEITNQSTVAGAIIADAIRWGGGFGDIVRPGPGSVSGYSRDEECQRYWAESELGNNAFGFDSDIWDISGADDGSDNVRCGAKWAREMNQTPAGGVLVERWKRIHLEFHTNAAGCSPPPCSARGQICLITDLGETTYQQAYATMLSNEIDADLLIADADFEHTWVDRSSATYTSSYGAICTPANGDEFDATIAELAFHDNQEDAELLRDDRVRAAMARACLHGIIRFLNYLPGSTVPLAFLPDTPRSVRAAHLGNGAVQISWVAPLSDGARGDPATGYVVYQSDNGYGFGDPVVLGNVLTTTISGLAAGETRYFRVAATNAGGESMPSEVLVVRRPTVQTEETPRLLIVNGFDRLRRQINPIQEFTQPPAYAGDSIERQIWRRSNSYDYVVQHAEAIAATDLDALVDSCSNESVINSYVQLGDYDVIIWILGTESTEDATFTTNEQSKVQNFLLDGGGLFLSGAEVAYDLINQGGGVSFAQNTLRIGYAADDANTFQATGASGSILSTVGSFNFDPDNGAPYEVYAPDVLTPGVDAQACLNYVGGSGGVAGVQYWAGSYAVVSFGFPFETITSSAKRTEIMQEVITYLLAPEPRCFDYDRDYDVDMTDFNYLAWCFQGPDHTYTPSHICVNVECEDDLDIDLADFEVFQRSFTGSLK